jgi:glycogen debranching enzyme
LFAGDTRVLSTYRLAINGRPWRLLGRSRPDTASGTWHFQNAAFMAGTGEVPPQSLHLRLERGVDDALHERLTVESFADRRLRATVSLHLDADFADLFEVKDQRPPRPSVGRSGDAGISIAHERRGSERALDVRGGATRAALVGTRLLFDLSSVTGTRDASSTRADGLASSVRRPSEGRRRPSSMRRPSCARRSSGVADLRALEMRDDHGTCSAGGAP